MSSKLIQAQKHVDAHRAHVNDAFRPRYHLSTPVGWLNDPNGFCAYQGQYHLFYQHHPYASVWGPMHWGHWVSRDLVHWREAPIAMAPDEAFDEGGCFSGTALEVDGSLHLMYTGVTEETVFGKSLQQQCMAESTDGITFTKWADNPVISANALPPGASPYDFRDPKLWKAENGYRAIVASRGHQHGQLLCYESTDLHSWRYQGVFLSGLGGMCECPDFFDIADRQMLFCCLMDLKADSGYPVPQPVVYALGAAGETGGFIPDAPLQMLDWGLDFYAPQTTLTLAGERVLIGWMLSPGHEMPTNALGHGWAGMMTIPRVLTVEEGRLHQRPYAGLASLRKDAVAVPARTLGNTEMLLEGASGPSIELDMTLSLADAESITLRVMENGPEYAAIGYDVATQTLYFDRSRLGYEMGTGGKPEENPVARVQVPLQDGRLRLQVFVDTCSVEIFAQDGLYTMSSLAFPRFGGQGISLAAQGTARLDACGIWSLDAIGRT